MILFNELSWLKYNEVITFTFKNVWKIDWEFFMVNYFDVDGRDS